MIFISQFLGPTKAWENEKPNYVHSHDLKKAFCYALFHFFIHTSVTWLSVMSKKHKSALSYHIAFGVDKVGKTTKYHYGK